MVHVFVIVENLLFSTLFNIFFLVLGWYSMNMARRDSVECSNSNLQTPSSDTQDLPYTPGNQPFTYRYKLFDVISLETNIWFILELQQALEVWQGLNFSFHIGSVVSKIIWHSQTDRHTFCYFHPRNAFPVDYTHLFLFWCPAVATGFGAVF